MGARPIVRREEWAGHVHGRVDPADAIFVKVPLQKSPRGGSGTFLAQCSDDQLWWVKPPNHLQDGKVIVTEYVVGRVGALVGAPVCEVAIVRIPPEVVGWEFRDGHALIEGYGNGSRMVADALESNTLEARERNDNRKRHAGVFALYDWAWGSDDQWLYSESADRAIFSHDHGWYLPESGPEWSEATLTARIAEAHQAGHPVIGLDRAEIRRLADRLDSITSAELTMVLSSVPMSWPVADDELCGLGWFLEQRARDVASRLQVLAGGLP